MVCTIARFDVSFGTIYLMNVQSRLGSIKVSEWPPFWKKLLPRITLCSL